MSNIEVSSLSYYPIKSCGPVTPAEAELTPRGLAYDREWMLVNDADVFVSQRTHPELALVNTDMQNGNLLVRAPGQENITLSLDATVEGQPVEIDLFKKPGSGIDQGKDIADYFSEYLKQDVRLLRLADERHLKPELLVEGAVTTTGFADGFPILLTSESSLRQLNLGLDSDININRFRGNIVIDGDNLEPYEEDYWREVRVGSMTAFVVRACARCPVPNIDQTTGVLPKERTVSKELRRVRKGIDSVNDSRGEFFGQNLIHVFEPGQTIKVGDKIEVVERSAERNIELQAAPQK